MKLTLKNGIASEYEASTIWVENFNKGSNASLIEFEDDKKFMTPCKITNVIKLSNFDSNEKYKNAVDRIINVSHALATAEFVTDKDVYYVEIEAESSTERLPVEEIIYDCPVC